MNNVRELLALKELSQINSRFEVPHLTQLFSSSSSQSIVLIQARFDYPSKSAWYANFIEKLQLGKMIHILLSVNYRFNCINSSVFKYLDTQCPYYLSGPSEAAPQNKSSLRNSYLKLKTLFTEQVKKPTFSLICQHGIKNPLFH